MTTLTKVSLMRRGRLLATTATVALAPCLGVIPTQASAQDLASFAVLAGSTITNTGPTTINGNVGLSPGSAITGFSVGLGTVTPPFTIHNNDAVAAQAQNQLTTAYNVLANRPATTDLTGQDLAGKTLVAGVYNFDTSAQLTGNLTLDGAGDPNAIFVINIGSTLTTGSGSSVTLINMAQAGNVFFRVGSSATLGAATAFQGKILALTSITLVTGATINCGAALARNGAVTLDTNTIGICPVAPVVIGPGTGGGGTTTGNGTSVLDAINDFVASGGVLPLGFQVLAVLTPAELADAMTQLSGEAGTGAAPTGIQAMDSFLDLVMENHQPPPARPRQPPQQPSTVRVLGYGPEESPVLRSTFESLDPAAGGQAPERLWEIWAAGYGGETSTDGNNSRGTHDRFESNYGIATGINYRLSPDSEIGLALAGGHTDFDLAGDLGGGQSDMFQTALFGRTNFDSVYLAGALAYAFHDFTTDRSVTFAGDDHFSAEFSGHNVAGDLEAGYRFGWLTPYAGFRGQVFYTPDYSEKTESGVSTFALDYEANTTTTARSELGARIDWTTGFDDGEYVGLHGRAAWAHEFWTDNSINAAFQALPGSKFTVEGAEEDSDSVLVSAGAEVGFGNGIALSGTFDGEFADNSRTYGGTGRVSYRW